MSNKYTYKALDQNRNRIIKGTIQANNEYALEQLLTESNLTLISFKKVNDSLFGSGMFDRITSKDLVSFFIHLEQLEKAGVPLLDSLSDLKDFSDNQKIREVATDLYESVKSGKLLSEAMEKHKKIFDPVMISLVRMGEKTGGLQSAFKNIYENLKWSNEIKRKTVKAIRYPLFSLFVLFVVTAVMLKLVVPKVMGFIIDQGIPIPGYTEALIATSDFVEAYFLDFVILCIVSYILIQVFSRNKSFKYKVDEVKLKMPLLGSIIVKIEMSKFTRFFGVTFASGIPVLECLQISGDIVKNTVLRDDIERVKESVSDGKSVYNALASSKYFPGMVLRMFKVGEDSGNMVDAMENIQYFYSMEINDSIDKIIGTLQPSIIFTMGGLMAWVILAVFGPIYGNFDNFGGI